MVEQTLNKYIIDNLNLSEAIDTTSDTDVFGNHDLSKVLEMPLPFITRAGKCSIYDAFAYLNFLIKHSNKNNLSISHKWFNQRSIRSRSLRKRIIDWLINHKDYICANIASITVSNNTAETWQNFCRSYPTQMGAVPLLFAAAEIFQRNIYVVLLNRDGKNILVFRSQTTSNNKRSAFIIGKQEDCIFVPLLKKKSNIRLLGVSVTNHLHKPTEESQIKDQNFIVTTMSEAKKKYKIIPVNNQPLNYNDTTVNVQLTWIHSTAPHLVRQALKAALLLNWDTAYEYYQRVTKEAKECAELFSQYVYQPLLKKSEELFDKIDVQLYMIQERIEKSELEQGAQDYYDEYVRPNESDYDEDEILDELTNDDQTDESDEENNENRISRDSYSLDTLEDDNESVTETKEHIKSVVKDLTNAVANDRLLSSSDLRWIFQSLDSITIKSNEYDDRISKYPDDDDDDDLDEYYTAEDPTKNNEYASDTVIQENPSLEEIIDEVNAMKNIVKKKVLKINKKLMAYKVYLKKNQENLLQQKHRSRALLINEFGLQYGTAKRCPSVYFIYAGYTLVYIGLTTAVTSRFASGHAAFTKLLDPHYHNQPFRICFFALDINGSAIEHSRSQNQSVTPQTTTTSNPERHSQAYEENLLDCIEQLLINHFKPVFNTQGIEKLHGVDMDLVRKITIELPVIFLSPYPELIGDEIQDVITINA